MMRQFLLGLSLQMKDLVGTMQWAKLSNAGIGHTDKGELEVGVKVWFPV